MLAKRVSVKELPDVLQLLIAEYVGNNEARITIVSHTEIVIHNNPVE